MKYRVDIDYFKNPTAVSVYWLGFLHADGCVFTRRNGHEWLLQFKLKRSDEYQIINFRKVLKYTGPIKRPDFRSSAVCIYSKALCAVLMDLGIYPGKSSGSSQVPREHIAGRELEFMQGYFDGNGCLSKDNNGLKLSVSGPYEHIIWFRAQVATHVDIVASGSLFEKGEHTAEVSWHGNICVPEISRWLFKKRRTPRLNRKVQTFKALWEVYHS